MLGLLDDAGYRMVSEPKTADIILVNTCGFLGVAREESLEMLRDMAEYRRTGCLKRLVVTGCMADRDRQWLQHRVDGIDQFVSSFQLDRLIELIQPEIPIPEPLPSRSFQWSRTPRWVSTPLSYGFVKISDGCDNCCAYCRIPFLRGPFRSKPADDVLLETVEMVESGRKEIVVISQDTTSYGKDGKSEGGFLSLIERMAGVPGLRRLRLMYLYPSRIDERFLEMMMAHPAICRYLDIPLQHTDPAILMAMNRAVPGWMAGGTDPVLRFIENVRKNVPGIAIRTTLMTGFPGEDEASFQSMLDVVENGAFDHLGVFVWSPEPDTPAAGIRSGLVEHGIAEDRASKLMVAQAEVVEDRNRSRLGETVMVVVDGPDTDCEGYVTGRTEFQAPEVDGIVRIGRDLPAGSWGWVRLNSRDMCDFEAAWIEEVG